MGVTYIKAPCYLISFYMLTHIIIGNYSSFIDFCIEISLYRKLLSYIEVVDHQMLSFYLI